MTVQDRDRELERLEESLWRRETRFDERYMRRITPRTSFELGRSGRIYDRAELLGMPDQEIPARLPLKDFAVHEGAPSVVLVTYVSDLQYPTREVGNRSSLWVNDENDWKLRFHQGTPVELGAADRV